MSPLLTLPETLDPYRGAIDDPPPRPQGWVAAVSVVLRAAAPGPGSVGASPLVGTTSSPLPDASSRAASTSSPSAGASPLAELGSRAPEVLLIKRSAHDRDPWSGHMALPGGRRDPDDASLLHTAQRETEEEVALPLAEVGRLLGRLGAVAPRNAHLPPLTILPLVFAVPPHTEARIAAPTEVDEIHWVSLDHLRDPARHIRYRYPGAGDLTFPAWDVSGRAVWGLTHRVLTDLLERLPGG